MTLPTKKEKLRSMIHQSLRTFGYLREANTKAQLGNEIRIRDLEHFVHRVKPADGRRGDDALILRYSEGQRFLGVTRDELKASQDEFVDRVIGRILFVATMSESLTWVSDILVTLDDEVDAQGQPEMGMSVEYTIYTLRYPFGVPPYDSLTPVQRGGYNEHRFRLIDNRGTVLQRAPTLSMIVDKYYDRPCPTQRGDNLHWYDNLTKQWVPLDMLAIHNAHDEAFVLMQADLPLEYLHGHS